MTATPLGFSAYDTADSLGSVCNALANGSVGVSAAIDNTVATLGHAAYEFGDVWLVMSSAIAVPAAGGFVSAVALLSLDGTNYEVDGVSNSQIFPVSGSVVEQLLPSTSYSVVCVKGLRLRPSLLKIAVLNQSGVAFAATVTASLYRGEYQAG